MPPKQSINPKTKPSAVTPKSKSTTQSQTTTTTALTKPSNKKTPVVDDRFKDVFDDEDFGVKSLDKFQRVQKKSTKDAIKTIMHDHEDSSDDNSDYQKPSKQQQQQKQQATKVTSKQLPPTKLNPKNIVAAPQVAAKRRVPPQSRIEESEEEEEEEEMGQDDDEDVEGNEELEESSTDIGTDDDYDDHDEYDEEDEEEIIPEGYTMGSLPGSYAPIIENPTKRLALYNMEWDQLKAVDILAIFRSLCPLGGKITRVSVFPSEKGKIMLEREKNGDFTLWTDEKIDDLIRKAKDEKTKKASKNQNNTNNKKGKKQQQTNVDEDSDSDGYLSDAEIDQILFGANDEDKKTIEANRVKLKEYELAKLGYYYAIIECDTVDTAVKLYHDADGLEYESSGNVFDLRFVPDEHVFDEKTLRDRSTLVPPGHRPPVFQTNCLNSTSLECTWEREDPKRSRVLHQDYSQGEYRVDDLTAFLANESDDEGFNTDVPVSETDDETPSNNDESDDDSGEDGEYISSERPAKIRTDTLGRDRIANTKMVDGKKKNVILLKRRARNDFADILAEIKSDSKETKAKSSKKDIINKANEELRDGDDDEDDGAKDDFGSDWSENDDVGAKMGDDDDMDDDDRALLARRKVLDAKKAKLESEKASKAKKPMIILQSALDLATESAKPKAKNILKETQRSLNLDFRRERRLEEWGKQFNRDLDEKKVEKVDTKKMAIGKDVVEETKKNQLATKQSKLAAIEGSIYDDDELDDDDFFKNAEQYFPQEEFGVVTFSKKSATKQQNDDEDSDEAADLAVKSKLKDHKLGKRKLPKQAQDDGSDSDENEGYNLQELVQKNKIKQMAIQHKKKSAKELENDLINQSLGVDAYTTNQNTQLSSKDLKAAAYAVNKQSADKAKNKKLKVNLNAMVNTNDNPNVSLKSGGAVKSDQFKIDVHDERIKGLFDDADFGIDTTSSLFHNTEGTSELLAEAQRRRADKQAKQVEVTKKRKVGGINDKKANDSGISNDVQQLIAQTKSVAANKKNRK